LVFLLYRAKIKKIIKLKEMLSFGFSCGCWGYWV